MDFVVDIRTSEGSLNTTEAFGGPLSASTSRNVGVGEWTSTRGHNRRCYFKRSFIQGHRRHRPHTPVPTPVPAITPFPILTGTSSYRLPDHRLSVSSDILVFSFDWVTGYGGVVLGNLSKPSTQRDLRSRTYYVHPSSHRSRTGRDTEGS